jgi:hypothetical protein
MGKTQNDGCPIKVKNKDFLTVHSHGSLQILPFEREKLKPRCKQKPIRGNQPPMVLIHQTKQSSVVIGCETGHEQVTRAKRKNATC